MSQSELVLYFDSHNAKLCQFYSQCVPTPLYRHDTKTVKGRITLASFFCQPCCPELKPFLLRKRELHLEIGYLQGNILAVAGPTIGDDANAVGANTTLQECLHTCQNFDAYIDNESWCINNVSDPSFKSLTTLLDERRTLAAYSAKQQEEEPRSSQEEDQKDEEDENGGSIPVGAEPFVLEDTMIRKMLNMLLQLIIVLL